MSAVCGRAAKNGGALDAAPSAPARPPTGPTRSVLSLRMRSRPARSALLALAASALLGSCSTAQKRLLPAEPLRYGGWFSTFPTGMRVVAIPNPDYPPHDEALAAADVTLASVSDLTPAHIVP